VLPTVMIAGLSYPACQGELRPATHSKSVPRRARVGWISDAFFKSCTRTHDGRMDPSQPRTGGPTRRSFTPAQKLEHLAAYEAAAAGGNGGRTCVSRARTPPRSPSGAGCVMPGRRTRHASAARHHPKSFISQTRPGSTRHYRQNQPRSSHWPQQPWQIPPALL